MDTSAPTTVTGYTTLSGETAGPVTVLDGGTLVIDGTHEGPDVLEGGASLLVPGVLHGSVEIASLATATILGDVVGQVGIRVAGTLLIEPGGRLAGPVTNYGSFTNRGTRTGPVEGRTPDDQSGATNSEPQRRGVYKYTLPERD